MKLQGERLELIAAAYVLGTLQGGARRRLETLARQHPEVREAVQRWQHHLAGLTELVPEVAPPAALWPRIEAVLRADLALRRGGAVSATAPRPNAPRPGARGGARALGWGWVSAGLGLALVAAVGWGQLQERRWQGDLGQLRQQLVGQAQAAQQAQAELANIHRVGQVAVLSDERSGAALLVTFDPQRQQLQVKRVGTYQEADEKSLQLWTLAPGQAPKSLGVLGRQTRAQLAAAPTDVNDQRVLAVSLEPLGGVPSERGPTGPVLFKGAVLGV